MGHRRTLWSDLRVLFDAVAARFEPVLYDERDEIEQRFGERAGHPRLARWQAASEIPLGDGKTVRSRQLRWPRPLAVRRSRVTLIALAASLLTSQLAVAPSRAANDGGLLSILAIGDSYTAGNGAGGFSGDLGCARSSDNYSSRFKRMIEESGTGQRVFLHNEACNGATTDHFWNTTSGRRPMREAVDKGYDLIFLTLGGNDLSFAEVVEHCLVKNRRTYPNCKNNLERAEGLIHSGALEARITGVLSRIAMDKDPRAKVVLVGYPHLEGSDTFAIGSKGEPLLEVGKRVRDGGNRVDALQRRAVDVVNTRYPNQFLFMGVKDLFKNPPYEFSDPAPRSHELFAAAINPNRWLIEPVVDANVPWNYYHPNSTGHYQEGLLLFNASGIPKRDLNSDNPPPPPPNGLSRYAGHIVQWNGDTKVPKTAWYVTPDLKRLYIPDAVTYGCLKDRGAPGPDVLSSQTLDQLQDQNEKWAACGNTMPTKRSLRRGMALTANNGRFTLALQGDGNLVLYAEPCHRVLWANGKFNTDYVWTQPDGNIVGYTNSGQPTWSTGTAGKGADRIVVQDDGNLVVYAGNRPLWWTGTVQPGGDGCRGIALPPLPPLPPLIPPRPPSAGTFSETTGGATKTWTNYSNAGGEQGPTIPARTTVQIACKVTGFRVPSGNTWWYRIASSPWDSKYYASADAFYNNGQTSGSLRGTPFVDPRVPDCGAPPITAPPTTVPPTTTSTTSTTVPPPRTGRIVFGSTRDGNYEVYSMDPTGAESARLTQNSTTDGTPALSPDGRKVAFESFRDGNFEIYLMNPDGSSPTRLTNNPEADGAPTWSSDGQRIAFMRGPELQEDIWTINIDGTGETRLTTQGGRFPDWSPGGARIAFDSNRSGNYEIYVMAADGSGQINVSNSPSTDGLAKWSPDSNRLAFSSFRDGNFEIYAMNSDGSSQVRLTNNPEKDQFPSWSPDGKSLAFNTLRDGNSEIYVMNADGTQARNVSNHGAIDEKPRWGLKASGTTSTTSTTSTSTSTTTPVSTVVTKVWSGSSTLSADWSEPSNWVGTVPPRDGDSLSFPSGASRLSSNNDIDGLDVGSMTFEAAGYSISGNLITLNKGITLTAGVPPIDGPYCCSAQPAVRIAVPISLGADQNWRVTNNGTWLQIDGLISGSKSFTKSGEGILTLTADNTYTGLTAVSSGSLVVRGNQPLSSIRLSRPSDGSAPGRLNGTGTVGPVTADAFGIVSPEDPFGPGVTPTKLTTTGTLSMKPESTFIFSSTSNYLGENIRVSTLEATGTILDGAFLRGSSSYSMPIGTVLTIISNQGSQPVQGIFRYRTAPNDSPPNAVSDLPEGAEFEIGTRYQVSYVGGDGNDVTLTVVGHRPVP